MATAFAHKSGGSANREPMGPGPAAVERSIGAFRAAACWDIAP
ncbi:MAG TPA: hypothetical protein VE864_13030 [Streptosporangiaceae bacterium]|nr:hypothetical protein [Streptosporangiaceae bacterium]